MRAAQITRYGGPDVIVVDNDVPRPRLGEGQVLIEVHAASLNPVDTYIREGRLQKNLPLRLPSTIGGDFAGIIAELGPGASGVAVGDEVYGQANTMLGGSSTLAELAAARADFTAPKPKSVDFTTAASLPLAGASAVQAITEHLNVQRGQRILIQGAAGGVGSVAVQIAKHLGAYIIGTAFTADLDFVKSLGADEVIDAKAQKFEEFVRDVDGVFDTVGGDTITKSFGVMKRGGVLVTMRSLPADEAPMREAGVKAIAQFTQPTAERLTKLANFVDQGVVKPNVDKVFPLDEAAAAFKYRETANPRGKVVVAIR